VAAASQTNAKNVNQRWIRENGLSHSIQVRVRATVVSLEIDREVLKFGSSEEYTDRSLTASPIPFDNRISSRAEPSVDYDARDSFCADLQRKGVLFGLRSVGFPLRKDVRCLTCVG
jgi:hypothetical protein